MQKQLKNYAFIDSQNVNLGIRELGWKLDWYKFRIYLKEKYGVSTAYMFIGYMEENQDLYQSLQKCGYILVFKEILKNKDGFVKGNCDAELVLQAMIDYEKYKRAIIVSGDGDFACLVRHLKKQNKLAKVLVPNMAKYSALLKKATANEYLDFMNNLKCKLIYGTPAKCDFGNEICNSRANRPERPSIISPFANANTTSTSRDVAVSGEDTAKSDESFRAENCKLQSKGHFAGVPYKRKTPHKDKTS